MHRSLYTSLISISEIEFWRCGVRQWFISRFGAFLSTIVLGKVSYEMANFPLKPSFIIRYTRVHFNPDRYRVFGAPDIHISQIHFIKQRIMKTLHSKKCEWNVWCGGAGCLNQTKVIIKKSTAAPLLVLWIFRHLIINLCAHIKPKQTLNSLLG